MKPIYAYIATALLSSVVSSQAFALDRAGVDTVRDKAIAILAEKGIKAGIKYLADPAHGLIDLKGPGLHTWAVTRKGIIVYDLSKQTKPGMDVSTLVDDKGQSEVKKTFKCADQPGGCGYPETSWPHPVTGVLEQSYVSCKLLPTDKNVAVCAMAWIK